MNPSTVSLREFQPGDETAFRDLNVEWIERYFAMEPKDLAIIEHANERILSQGGRILLAFDNNGPIGCCALVSMSPGEYEVAKMAVTTHAQGRGLGRKLLEATVELARSLGATRLYLETNHTLVPAISLYRKCGFTDVPTDRIVPSPYVRADVFMERFF